MGDVPGGAVLNDLRSADDPLDLTGQPTMFEVTDFPECEPVMQGLLKQCLNPPLAQRRRAVPIVVLRGPRGSGLDTLLDQLVGACSGTRPVAQVSLDPAEDRRAGELAVDLAYQ